MNKVIISGWEIELPLVNNFSSFEKLLLNQEKIRSKKYFSDDKLANYFKFQVNPNVIQYKNKEINLFDKIRNLIDSGLQHAQITWNIINSSRVKIYLSGQGPRANFIDYQGFYDKNDAEDVKYSPNIKKLHASSYAQDSLANKLFKLYQLCFPPISIYCASNSALMAVHIARQEIKNKTIDIAIILSWNDILLQDLAFMDGQNMLVTEHAQPLSKQSDGVLLSAGYSVLILEEKEQVEKRKNKPLPIIHSSLFMQSNAEKNLGGTLFNFYTISKLIINVLELSSFSPLDIGAIFIHGNGSIISDKAEVMAISHVFKENLNVPIISYKGQIGYISNCSGVIDLIIMANSLNKNRLIPSASHYPIDDAMDLNFLSDRKVLQYKNKPMLKIGLGMDGSLIAMILISDEEK